MYAHLGMSLYPPHCKFKARDRRMQIELQRDAGALLKVQTACQSCCTNRDTSIYIYIYIYNYIYIYTYIYILVINKDALYMYAYIYTIIYIHIYIYIYLLIN